MTSGLHETDANENENVSTCYFMLDILKAGPEVQLIVVAAARQARTQHNTVHTVLEDIRCIRPLRVIMVMAPHHPARR